MVTRTEEDLRTGGNLHCPYCGRKYSNREFVDADMMLKLERGLYVYCETWMCKKCKKQVWVGTDLIKIEVPRK